MTVLAAIAKWLIGRWGISLIWIPIALAGLGFFAKLQYDAYQRGFRASTDAVNKETIRVELLWKDIQGKRISFDDAIRGLRNRSDR